MTLLLILTVHNNIGMGLIDWEPIETGFIEKGLKNHLLIRSVHNNIEMGLIGWEPIEMEFIEREPVG